MMNKLHKIFREKLLGHLSDHNTELDVNIAVGVCKNEILAFNLFLRENYEHCMWNSELYESNDSLRKFTIEQILEIYLKQE